MNEYPYGATVRLKTSTPFANAAGTATDPTTITLRVLAPDGTETSYTYAGGQLTRVAAGDYYRDVTVTQVGTWTQRWEGTGTVAAVHESQFWVKPTAFLS